MAKKKTGSASTRKRRTSSATTPGPNAYPSVAKQLTLAPPAQAHAAKKKFVEGVLARGEAVPAGQPLGPGVTHEIVGTDEQGTPQLARRRFSLVGARRAATPKPKPATRKKK
jgi:hypothetical protein